MNRIAAGIIFGVVWMLFAPFFFTEWEINSLMNVSLYSQFTLMGTKPLSALALWFSLGFEQDASFFLIINGEWLFNPISREIVWMVVMTWLSMAFMLGVITKGPKKGFLGALGLFIIFFALYLIFAVLDQRDLATMFTGANLIDHAGVVLTGFICVLSGSLIGGWLGGASEA